MKKALIVTAAALAALSWGCAEDKGAVEDSKTGLGPAMSMSMEEGMGGLVEFSDVASAQMLAGERPTVLFFHADWCPLCRADLEELEAGIESLGDITVVVVDYDRENDLKRRYGVGYQHTYVQIDEDGDSLALWNGGGLEGILSKVNRPVERCHGRSSCLCLRLGHRDHPVALHPAGASHPSGGRRVRGQGASSGDRGRVRGELRGVHPHADRDRAGYRHPGRRAAHRCRGGDRGLRTGAGGAQAAARLRAPDIQDRGPRGERRRTGRNAGRRRLPGRAPRGAQSWAGLDAVRRPHHGVRDRSGSHPPDRRGRRVHHHGLHARDLDTDAGRDAGGTGPAGAGSGAAQKHGPHPEGFRGAHDRRRRGHWLRTGPPVADRDPAGISQLRRRTHSRGECGTGGEGPGGQGSAGDRRGESGPQTFSPGARPTGGRLEDFGPAPPIVAEGSWFNTEDSAPLTMEDLRGKVVLVDFWTYSCVNCVRTIPYLKSWYEEYEDQGFVIVGVHTPEFEFEKEAANVRRAVRDLGIDWPVVLDNRYVQWRAYSNRYWPAHYFIDAEGRVRYYHFGEGEYDTSGRVIRRLLQEAGERVRGRVSNPDLDYSARTPETYLGYGRSEGFVSAVDLVPGEAAEYRPARSPENGEWTLSGVWTVAREYIVPESEGALELGFHARNVFLVVEPSEPGGSIRVEVDGSPAGDTPDVEDGVLRPTESRLHQLLELPQAGPHVLRLEVRGRLRLFAFTFG